MIKNIALILIVSVILLAKLEAQVKYEKEYRLNQKDVPKPALDFVNTLGFDRKIKWYKEEGLNKTSIEAKTKYLSKRYSVEFNSKGEIEDIEVEIKLNEISEEVRQNILNYLNTNYQKANICKIQIQFSGDPDALSHTIVNQKFTNNPEVITRYEIVVKVKNKKKHEKLEYLFDDQGEMLQKAVILLKNTDNLEY